MHAAQYLKSPSKHSLGALVAIFGTERYLRHEAQRTVVNAVLGEGDDRDASLTRVAGKEAELRSVCDELRTVSMWGDARVVIVEDADEFVSDNRSGLEKYLEKPAKKAVLVLDLAGSKAWGKTTRLYKAVEQAGLNLDCSPLPVAEAIKWLVDEAKSQYDRQLLRDAAALMVELVGPQMGLLSQELGKTAAYVGERPKITVEDVATMVGGWRLETTWALIDALQAGQLPVALGHLDKLLAAGEAALMLLGGFNFTYRKLAQATELARQGKRLGEALAQAGVFPNRIPANEAYLRRLGRARAEQIYAWLLEADGAIKGEARLPERLVLERLLLRLGGAA